MIEEYVKIFNNKRKELVEEFQCLTQKIYNYDDLVKRLIYTIHENTEDGPIPEGIQKINYGCYQGSYVYIISNSRDFPSKLWMTLVNYGSCGGCDTLCAINDGNYGGSDDTTVGYTIAQKYVELMLHMLQSMKLIYEYGR